MPQTTIQNNRIKAAIAEKRLTTKEVADALGVCVNLAYRKLGGQSSWTLHDIEVLHDLTGKSFDYFWGL